MEGGRGSAGGAGAGTAAVDESEGAAAELEMAATVDGCEESTDVAISSSLDVAASSLRYIPVSFGLGAANVLFSAITWFAGAANVCELEFRLTS